MGFIKKISIVLVVACFLTGCAATTTAIEKRDLETTTKMSETIFLEPISPSERTVYLDVRNTSNKAGLENELKPQIAKSLDQKGYKIVDDPKVAHYMLQANVLQIGKADPKDINNALSSGYGNALSGALVGASAAGITSDNAAVGGLIGAGVGYAANMVFKDVIYSLITDVQISERPQEGEAIKVSNVAALKQGKGATKLYKSKGFANWLHYRTRVVSTAEKMNLKFEEAEPSLMQGLGVSLAGVF